MDPYFYLILGLIVTTGTVFAFITRGVLYATPDTDNELMAYAAAQSHKWHWLSDLHKMGMGKTGMKDLTVILISVFQKIFHDKESDHPYIALAGIVHAFSSLLVYFIATEYWDPVVALFLGLIYLFSVWNWQIALYGGHANVATMLILLSVLFIQQTNNGLMWPEIWLITAGIIFCFAQFASASTIKYTPLFFAAIIFERYQIFSREETWSNAYLFVLNNQLYGFNISVIVVFLLSILFLSFFYKKIVSAIYYKKAPQFLNKIMSGRELFPIEHYLQHAKKRIGQLTILGAWVVVGFLLLINLMGPYYFFMIISGFIVGFLALTLPNIKKSFRYYFNFLLETQIRRKTHFKSYVGYFTQKGLSISRHTRGAGLIWLPKMFMKIIPFHTIIFIISVVGSLYAVPFLSGNIWINYTHTFLIIMLSLSPIIWAEITKAPQLSRSYSPGLIGMILLVGYGVYLLHFFSFNYFYPLIITVLSVMISWNLWIFLSDVYPARMGATYMFRSLKGLNIKEIYTYMTKYNRAMVDTIPGLDQSEYVPRKKIDPPFVVHYINSINDVKDGWIVIPGTNGRSLSMSGEQDAINDNFSFTKDPALNKLIESKDIEKVASIKLKTYGTSHIWSLEDEVLGYMDLILNEIGPADIYRGHAWLIHSSRLGIKS